MGRLDEGARMTIRTLVARGATRSEIARLLGVTEGTVRYQVKRMASGAADGRSRQKFAAEVVAGAIEHWRSRQDGGGVNLAALHDWLRREHGYGGSLRSVQRYWRRAYPAPAMRARRRVETPPGGQAQVDWAHFPGVIVAGESVDLLALHMVLSWSRAEAIVWSRGKDALSWLACHTACLARLGGVPATLRVDNEKAAVSRGAGAWGTVNPAYRRYAALMRFHVDACAPRQPRAKGKVERRVRDHRAAIGPYGRDFADLAALQAWTDGRVAARAAERRCPATGTSVAEAWARERPLLTPLPETAPEPFDLVVTRTVGRDGLVAFEGRHYSVPFQLAGDTVEVRGIAGAVQVLKACQVVARHPRGTERRLLIDPRHYDGPDTARVIAPPPLGRMGARLQELAAAPVARRSLDLYAALAEVAR
jgi:transposase